MTDRTDTPASSKAGINETSRRCRKYLRWSQNKSGPRGPRRISSSRMRVWYL